MNMATFHSVIVAMAVVALALGQRPSFAGTRPIGFPEVEKTTTTADPLGNRFGETGGTTERLPIEARGDRDLVERISKLPIDQQPFWYLNWKALEAQRKNPQTYPQRPSQFGEPLNTINAVNFEIQTPSRGNFNPNSGTANASSGTLNSNSGRPDSNSGTSNSNSGTQNTGVPNENVQLGNRNGGTGTYLSGHTKPAAAYRSSW